MYRLKMGLDSLIASGFIYNTRTKHFHRRNCRHLRSVANKKDSLIHIPEEVAVAVFASGDGYRFVGGRTRLMTFCEHCAVEPVMSTEEATNGVGAL